MRLPAALRNFPVFFFDSAGANRYSEKKRTREIDLSEIGRAANMNGAVRIERGMLLAEWDKRRCPAAVQVLHFTLCSSHPLVNLFSLMQHRANSHERQEFHLFAAFFFYTLPRILTSFLVYIGL